MTGMKCCAPIVAKLNKALKEGENAQPEVVDGTVVEKKAVEVNENNEEQTEEKKEENADDTEAAPEAEGEKVDEPAVETDVKVEVEVEEEES